MRQTLRRSCAACAKSKHSCDLRTPRCSRCTKRRVPCVYANEPLTVSLAPSPASAPSTAPSAPDAGALVGKSRPLDGSTLYNMNFGSLDPFDSYPKTRLPRDQVQRLIHSFLNKISFQYYPLDLSSTSNPFLISWWPIALGDPALFHVSLQTACLDEELMAQRGFHSSEILMADSVALLRRKVQDPSLAVQDGTMNSVITLAAIEFGKGNTRVAEMHVDGVKRLVTMRGGINAVRQTSPLTARMVSWVSMLVMGHPQFGTQDDVGRGDGIPPPPEWQLDFPTVALPTHLSPTLGNDFSIDDIDFEVANVFIRLYNVFHRAQTVPLHSTRLHDLTCFVIHRLLLSHADNNTPNTTNDTNSPSNSALISYSPPTSVTSPEPSPSQSPSSLFSSLSLPTTATFRQISSPLTECIRYAIILYLFITQGPIYYSHVVILSNLTGKFIQHLEQLDSSEPSHTSPISQPEPLLPEMETPKRPRLRDPLDIWLIAIGLVAATGTPHYDWFVDRARGIITSLTLSLSLNGGDTKDVSWEADILPRIKSVLWLDGKRGEDVFRPHWEATLRVSRACAENGDGGGGGGGVVVHR